LNILFRYGYLQFKKGMIKNTSVTDIWPGVTIVSFTMFTIALILRGYDSLETARVFHGISLVGFFFGSLHILSVHKKLGPKILMILNMVRYNVILNSILID